MSMLAPVPGSVIALILPAAAHVLLLQVCTDQTLQRILACNGCIDAHEKQWPASG